MIAKALQAKDSEKVKEEIQTLKTSLTSKSCFRENK
jgi:hypothetical protein